MTLTERAVQSEFGVFTSAIRRTWEAIAPDAIEADPSLNRATVEAIAEVTLDADRVEMFGGMESRTLALWKEFTRQQTYAELIQFAATALEGYA